MQLRHRRVDAVRDADGAHLTYAARLRKGAKRVALVIVPQQLHDLLGGDGAVRTEKSGKFLLVRADLQ